MDNFYNEMQNVIDDLSDRKTSYEFDTSSQESFLTQYFSNQFANVLISIAIRYWPLYIVESE